MGTELVNPATAREAIAASGLNFTVVKKPMKELVELNQADEVSDRWATVRTDTGDVLGIVEESYEPVQTGQGADLSRGTLWGAFNCVTEYTDHEMDGDSTTRLESIWFGRGEQLKLKAFQLAEGMM